MSDEKWDRRFLELAEHIAQWSKDPRTQVGSVIVDDKKRVVSLGYNGFPRGVDDIPERYADRTIKHMYVAHAERNALDNAPLMVDGCTLYTTLFPCMECAKSIIQKGITRVVSHDYEEDNDKFGWSYTFQMFIEAGVEFKLLTR